MMFLAAIVADTRAGVAKRPRRSPSERLRDHRRIDEEARAKQMKMPEEVNSFDQDELEWHSAVAEEERRRNTRTTLVSSTAPVYKERSSRYVSVDDEQKNDTRCTVFLSEGRRTVFGAESLRSRCFGVESLLKGSSSKVPSIREPESEPRQQHCGRVAMMMKKETMGSSSSRRTRSSSRTRSSVMLIQMLNHPSLKKRPLKRLESIEPARRVVLERTEHRYK